MSEPQRSGAPEATVAVEAAQAGKAIVVTKVGRSERGGEMVTSHTGAMADDAE